MNTVTPELQQVARLVGKLGDASQYSYAFLCFAMALWLYDPLMRGIGVFGPSRNVLVNVLNVVEASVWLIMFSIQPEDRKCFMAGSASLLAVPFFAANAILLPFSSLDPGLLFDIINTLTALVFGPLILLLSAAGPLRVAGVPYFGSFILRFIMGRPWKALTEICGCRREAPKPSELPVQARQEEPDVVVAHGHISV